jgi:Txe/YoeB family toxin of Txe-Axe toxin-antitoxin module
MIGYVDGATAEKDRLYDAALKFDNNQNFYSLIGDEAMNIQGRPLPFVETDQVRLGLKVNSSNTYKIAIASADGLFLSNEHSIYLEDKLQNIIHDLKQNPYTFTTVPGKLEDRFTVRYTNALLGNDNFSKENVTVNVSSNENEISTNTSNGAISQIEIYDVLGRSLYKVSQINSQHYSIKNLQSKHHTLMVKVYLTNGIIVTKKIVH